MGNTKQQEICIIGAGISGLTAGALLTKQGYKVTIFEKETVIGGRALSFDASSYTMDQYLKLLSRFQMNVPYAEPDLQTIFSKKLLDGYMLDLGYHAIGGGVMSNLNSVLATLDDHIETLESSVGFIKEGGYDFPFLSRLDKIKILPNILRLLFASEKTMRRLDGISMTKTIEQYGQGKMKLVLEIFSRSISTVNNLDRISTGEMFRAQRTLLKGSKPVGYPKNGLGGIHQKLAKAIVSRGGVIKTETPVQKILIEGAKATGVMVGNKEYRFDAVISTLLVQNLFAIADENHFPKDYVNMLKSLEGTGSLCAYYSLKEIDSRLLGKTFHFIERDIGVDGNDAVGMIDFMSAVPDTGVAPPSHHLVQSYIICMPKEARDKKTLDRLKIALDKNLERLIPDFRSQLRWVIYPAIWHLDGVAKTTDNTKPDIQTPVENLYVIGDCVKAPGIGINCAINSARIIQEMLTTTPLI
ncbi:MAG TPA: NAD(P)/FAD-dependent oxidoreductase [Thermoplasmata archaeon]|nr:MAG TPA: NAD(P)/FAD-dependent oxidoreductase [Thermoplasmata archaeon]